MMEVYGVYKTILKPIMEIAFDSKFANNGSIEEYQARFIIKGYSQKEGVDLDVTLSLLA
jgi:hypothetical protein